MKAKIKNFVIKNLSYDGIKNLDSAFDEIKAEEKEDLEVEDSVSISNQYALRKDNTGILASSEAELTSKFTNKSMEIQTATLSADLIVEFEFKDKEEKEIITSYEDKKVIDRLNSYLSPITQIYINNFFDFLRDNGPLNGGRDPVEIEINF
jgi:hypothetical protein